MGREILHDLKTKDMETKFTKGEWRQSHREKSDGMYSTEVYDEEGKTICTLAWHKVLVLLNLAITSVLMIAIGSAVLVIVIKIIKYLV